MYWMLQSALSALCLCHVGSGSLLSVLCPNGDITNGQWCVASDNNWPMVCMWCSSALPVSRVVTLWEPSCDLVRPWQAAVEIALFIVVLFYHYSCTMLMKWSWTDGLFFTVYVCMVVLVKSYFTTNVYTMLYLKCASNLYPAVTLTPISVFNQFNKTKYPFDNHRRSFHLQQTSLSLT